MYWQRGLVVGITIGPPRPNWRSICPRNMGAERSLLIEKSSPVPIAIGIRGRNTGLIVANSLEKTSEKTFRRTKRLEKEFISFEKI